MKKTLTKKEEKEMMASVERGEWKSTIKSPKDLERFKEINDLVIDSDNNFEFLKPYKYPLNAFCLQIHNYYRQF